MIKKRVYLMFQNDFLYRKSISNTENDGSFKITDMIALQSFDNKSALLEFILKNSVILGQHLTHAHFFNFKDSN